MIIFFFISKLLDELHSEGQIVITPTAFHDQTFLSFPHLKKGSQEDAAELLDGILTELQKVDERFRGSFDQKVTCRKCDYEETIREQFSMLRLRLPDVNPGSAVLTFEELFEKFVSTDQVPKTICPGCKSFEICFAKVKFISFPPILFVVVNRSQWDDELQKSTKSSSRVSFPSKFQIDTAATTESFRLRSVVEHVGIGTTSGHYRAYAKKMGKWLSLNDTSVTRIEDGKVKCVNPDILLFRKV